MEAQGRPVRAFFGLGVGLDDVQAQGGEDLRGVAQQAGAVFAIQAEGYALKGLFALVRTCSLSMLS